MVSVGDGARRVMQRTKSNASSCYLHPGVGAASGGHRKRESNISVSSPLGGLLSEAAAAATMVQERLDWSTISSSVAFVCVSWDDGNDNICVMSDRGKNLEAMWRERMGIGRRGIGEKMFGAPGKDGDGDNGVRGTELQPPLGSTKIDASQI